MDSWSLWYPSPQSARRRSDYPMTHRVLAASYAHLDRLDDARASLEDMLRLHPDFSLEIFKLTLSVADPAYVENYVVGLRKAGLKQ